MSINYQLFKIHLGKFLSKTFRLRIFQSKKVAVNQLFEYDKNIQEYPPKTDC